MPRMHIKAIARNQSGGVLVWVALVMTVLLAAVGIAMDYGRVYEAKTQAQHAADAAALAAAQAQNREDAEAAVTHYFDANTASGIQGLGMTPTLTNWSAGHAEVGVTASVPLTLSAIIGSGDIPVSVSSTAAQGESHFDTYVAVDLSGSLGIAADPANRAALEALTGCAFACHEPQKKKDDYALARENGIKLREDVLDAAFQNFVSSYFASNPRVTDHRRIDVIAFSGSPKEAPPGCKGHYGKWVQELTGGPTADPVNAQAALSRFALDDRQGTCFEFLFSALADPAFAGYLGSQGTGMTQTSPKKMLVLITDGVRSTRNAKTVWPIDEPINEPGAAYGPSGAGCLAIKNKGFTLAVINVKYADQTGEHWFGRHLLELHTFERPDGSQITSNVFSELPNALRQCASPGWYFEAEDTGQSGIDKAMAQLLDSINKSSLRLAQ